MLYGAEQDCKNNGFIIVLRVYCRYSFTETWELLDLFVGTKSF